MNRTTFSLDDSMLEALHRVAAERGVSIAAVIRESVELTLANHRPRPKSLGAGASGHRDTARRSAEERPEPRSWR